MLISLTAVVKSLLCVLEHVVFLKYMPSKHHETQVNLPLSSKRRHDGCSGLWSRGPGPSHLPIFQSHPTSRLHSAPLCRWVLTINLTHPRSSGKRVCLKDKLFRSDWPVGVSMGGLVVLIVD